MHRRSATVTWTVAAVAAAGCAASAKPTPQATDSRCRAQICHSDDGGCDAVVVQGFAWNGSACVPADASGCAAVGRDCGTLFDSLDACRRAYEGC